MTDGPMRQLWVLRHAKAVPHDAEDHGRRLAGRGRRQCAELAAHLAEGGRVEALPRLVLSSSAARARETAELVVGALGDGARIEIVKQLYRADAEDVIELVRETDDELPSVMVVGHNPTLEELVWVLVEGDEGSREELRGGLSTCALAVIGLDAPAWAACSPGGGRLLSLYAPTAR